jgi:hypothetical protein
VLEALTITSANNATTLIKKILFPTFDYTANMSQQAQLHTNHARELRELLPTVATVAEVIDLFAIFGVLTTLDPAIFDNFLSHYNRQYPTGIGAPLATTLSSLVVFTNTLSPQALSMKVEQSNHNREQKGILSFLTQVSGHSAGLSALTSAISKHPHRQALLSKLQPLSSKSPDPPSGPTLPSFLPLLVLIVINLSLLHHFFLL